MYQCGSFGRSQWDLFSNGKKVVERYDCLSCKKYVKCAPHNFIGIALNNHIEKEHQVPEMIPLKIFKYCFRTKWYLKKRGKNFFIA